MEAQTVVVLEVIVDEHITSGCFFAAEIRGGTLKKHAPQGRALNFTKEI